ncbi:Histidyl-tRNA synthetase [Mycoplasmopsis meleagridis]|uniref:Histidine--tRNA ligase n=1 Tax=Mycoplasmopsis meleagridis ATCC 25294 TaxID=1264554 RepID=A0A0F5H223_9BACT|nr:histidine--tRNA ligase [Mycoplasmopsis meleagridis]KKB26892.1 Histidyl-tRNA synthetase [Mycoplasmopsis meleagridis ATCC 25294]OAD18278.1 Histidyl-tRNA synthetase [Mycoplasmopsis meleagridis]VEU77548.1 Histidyl-tRNA synthetase [Mycoplasmopsis meleagridis]
MINKIKGTRDLNPREAKLIEMIRREFLDKARAYNFNWIDTPIIEQAQLYKRSVAGSEIVKKEMYEFKDKGDRLVALRPEGTAGFVRALVEEKWYSHFKSNKFAYFGPMFRYEQPQKGRYRQFNQAGVEFLSEANPYNDAEIILLAKDILDSLEISYTLKINSLGDLNSRLIYQEKLKEYLLNYREQLSSLSRERLENNVLRILDDKEDNKKDFVKKAPKINSYLNAESKSYYETFKMILKKNHVTFQEDFTLVRGLDYYDQIVFEFVANSNKKGAQSTLIGGGRYSNLISELGGPNISACGWGFGVDRCADLIIEEMNEYSYFIDKLDEKIDVYIAASDEENLNNLFSLTNELRKYEIVSEFSKEILKSKKIFDKASKLGAKYVIFNDPFDEGKIYTVKNLTTQEKIKFAYTVDGYADLLEFLATDIEQLNNLVIEEDE